MAKKSALKHFGVKTLINFFLKMSLGSIGIYSAVESAGSYTESKLLLFSFSETLSIS